VPTGGTGPIMSASEVILVGIELDTDHAPETNGRMSVCRRCGVLTDSPTGAHHAPDERQLDRSQSWLRMQTNRRHIVRMQSERHPPNVAALGDT